MDTKKMPPTPSQTLGPFYPSWTGAFLAPGSGDLLGPGKVSSGCVLRLEGRVLEEGGAGVRNVLVELWQADPDGRFDGAFTGWGRTHTDGEGRFEFVTVPPGGYATGGNRWRAPHLVLSIFGSGLMRRLVTNVFFEDEPHNDDDPVLQAVPPARRARLVATRSDGGPADEVPGASYRFDIVLRGDRETPFLAV